MKSPNLIYSKQNLSCIVSSCSLFCLLFLFVQTAIAQDEPQKFDRDGNPVNNEEDDSGARDGKALKAAARKSGGGGGSASAQKKIMDAIQEILDEQDRFGQTPSNNALLADLEDVLTRHSASAPKILVINLGPGRLTIEYPDGTARVLNPTYGEHVDVGSGRFYLVADGDFAEVMLKHKANSDCRFWDGDDNRHTKLEPSRSGNPATLHRAQLGRDLRRYYLEK